MQISPLKLAGLRRQALKPLEQGALPEGWRVVDQYEGSIVPESSAASEAERKLRLGGVRLMAVRHGESEANALAKELNTSVFCGATDSPLTEKGRKQAKAAAREVYRQLGGDDWMLKALKNPKLFPVIYTSPLSRAQDTALATSNYLTSKAYEMVVKGKADRGAAMIAQEAVRPMTNPNLQEANFGDYELRLIDDMREAHPDFTEKWDTFKGTGTNHLHRFPNGESRSDVLARVDGFLNEVAERHPGQTVLMFGHHGSVQAAKTAVGERTVVDGRLTLNAPEIGNATPIPLLW